MYKDFCVYLEFQSTHKHAGGLSVGAQIDQSPQRSGMNARTDIVAPLTTSGPLSGKSQEKMEGDTDFSTYAVVSLLFPMLMLITLNLYLCKLLQPWCGVNPVCLHLELFLNLLLHAVIQCVCPLGYWSTYLLQSAST